MAKRFKADDITALTGVATNVVYKWAGMGLLPCQRNGKKAQGRKVIFDELSVFIAAMLYTLMKRGLTLAYVEPVARFLGQMSMGQIADAAASGKVLVAAGAAIQPRLVEFETAALSQAASDAGAAGFYEV